MPPMLAEETIRKNLIRNVATILARKGVRIGKFEKAIGVYPGYMARMKTDANKLPAFDIILRMAEYLGVNVESLAMGNFDHPAENLDYLRKFARSLYARTAACEFQWYALTTDQIDESLPGGDVRRYPFGQAMEDDAGGPKRLSMEPWGYVNNTLSQAGYGAVKSFSVTGGRVSILDSVFSTMIEQDQRLYIVKYGMLRMNRRKAEPEMELIEWFELQLARENSKVGDYYLLCDTLGERELLYVEFEKLYLELKYYEHDPCISKRARNTIDKFLQSDPG